MGFPDGLTLVRLRDRPELTGDLHRLGERVWPRFMRQDPAGGMFFGSLGSTFSDCALVVLDHAGGIVARVLWVPFPWDGSLPLPEEGWDWVITRGEQARRDGTPCTAASALEIGIAPTLQSRGLSGLLLAAMREAVRELGLTDLFAPVRPNRKSDHPHLTMAEYLARPRADGLPDDPWLRVHARAGGEVLGPCERSMRIEGTIAEWQEWTGQDLSAPGEHLVPFALAPVVSDGERAVYVEPNVWVRHRVG